MFRVKYDMTEGMLRRVRTRTAALMRSHSSSPYSRRRYGTSTTSSIPPHLRREGTTMTNVTAPLQAGAGMSQRYSPVFERAEDPTLAEDFMPADPQTQHKIFRNLIMFDPIAGPATEYWKDLAFSPNVILSGIRDEKVIQFYQEAIEASGVLPQMPMFLSDYLTFGKFVFHMLMDERLGYWTETIMHDLDYVSIKVSPIPSMDPLIDIQPTQDMREWAVSADPRFSEQRHNVDPVLVSLMAAGSPIPLAPENTMFLPRQVFGVDYYGTSYLTRVMPFKIYEKALLDASIAGARRRAGPLWHITVWPDATDDEMSEVLDLFFAAEEDPIGGKVLTREGVTVNPIGGGGADFWKLSDEWTFLSEAKMRALGISEQFLCLAGDTYIPTEEYGIVPIETLQDIAAGEIQDLEISVAGKSGKAKTATWRYSGRTETIRVTTKLGYSVQSTPAHQMLVLGESGDLEWQEAKELSPGDILCVSTKTVTRSSSLPLSLPDHVPNALERNTKCPTKPEHMTPRLAFILGLLVSEGSHDRYRVRFSNTDTVLIQQYCDFVQQVFGLDAVVDIAHEAGTELEICGVATTTTKDSYSVELNSVVVASWLTHLGLLPGKTGTYDKRLSWYKEVPWSILEADSASQLAYIAAYIEGDGFVNDASTDIALFSRSETNLYQMQVMLASHGIVSNHMKKHHRLYISSVHARKLYSLIEPYLVTKRFSEEALEKGDNFGNVQFAIPTHFIRELLRQRLVNHTHDGSWYKSDDGSEVFVKKAGTTVTPFMGRTRMSYAAYKADKYDKFLAALKLISHSTHSKLLAFFEEEYYFDKVEKIESAEKTHVYDLSMATGEEPAFVANGLVVHNSGDANYNSMDMILSTFLEKVRSVRAHFTKKIIIEKIFMQLAEMHGFVKRSEAELAHGIRTGRKAGRRSGPEYQIPTVEWDKPLSPIADRDYLDILSMLEEQAQLPVPIRMRAQVAGFDIDKALESYESDLETRKQIYEYRRARAALAEQYGFTETGEMSEGGELGGGGGLEGFEGLEGGGGGGLEGFDLGGGGGEGLGELGGGEEAGGGIGELGGGEEAGGGGAEELPPAAPAGGEGGFGGGADLLSPRFPVPERSPRMILGHARRNAQTNILKQLENIPLWDHDNGLYGLTRRQVAKILDRIDHTDPRPDRRQKLAQNLTRELRRSEGLDSMQAELVQYLAIRLGYVPPVALSEETFDRLRKFIVGRMNGNGLTKAISNEIVMLSKVAEAGGRKPKSQLSNMVAPMQVLPRAEANLPENMVLTGITDLRNNPFYKG